MEKTLKKVFVISSVKNKTVALFGAIICAVVLPELLHAVGAVTGFGSSLGEIFLPMHISILLVGFLAGPAVGFLSGVSAPIISFFLTGMPSVVMLPFMVIELSMYGLFAGITAKSRLPFSMKLISAQFIGRAVKAIFIVAGFYLFSTKVAPAVIASSLVKGIPGLIIQWTLIPLIIHFADKKQ